MQWQYFELWKKVKEDDPKKGFLREWKANVDIKTTLLLIFVVIVSPIIILESILGNLLCVIVLFIILLILCALLTHYHNINFLNNLETRFDIKKSKLIKIFKKLDSNGISKEKQFELLLNDAHDYINERQNAKTQFSNRIFQICIIGAGGALFAHLIDRVAQVGADISLLNLFGALMMISTALFLGSASMWDMLDFLRPAKMQEVMEYASDLKEILIKYDELNRYVKNTLV